MKKKTDKTLLKELATWLKDHKAITLANELGYRTPATIDQWFIRKSIPGYQQEQVSQIIRRKENVSA